MPASIAKRTSTIFVISKNSINVVNKPLPPVNIFVISKRGSKVVKLDHIHYLQYKQHKAKDFSFKASDLLLSA